ncbi:hypothetical protein [Methylobacterium sp. WSM2598]|uniref:hypothetical protein n=1 Tax=Methylobacterium sp. WSM2598 TaxID=398261 RepID=UPI00036231BB|nr:hypothetical protein [Methylobacterium sp. WSM2598]
MPADASPEIPAPPEAPGVPVRTVLAAVAGFALFVAAAMGGLKLSYDRGAPRRERPPPRAMPQPGLQIDPAGDLKRLLDAQGEALSGYAWVDRERGIVRIPVARAMEILAGRGAAAFDPVGAPAAAPGPIKESRRP